MVKRAQKEWGLPVKLSKQINTEGYSSTQPFIAEVEGKECLFFASDKPGGKGKYDVYYSTIQNQGKRISAARNLGRKINTPDHDITPFYDTANACFYFSSLWHPGLGGYDVFKSCGRLKALPIPVNMGVPVNSTSNELYFSTYYDSLGFFSSNRQRVLPSGDTTSCCSDIYSFVHENQDHQLLDSMSQRYTSLEQLNAYLPVRLYFHNDRPNPKTQDTITSLSYLETYEAYTAMIDHYKEEYAKGLSGEHANIAKENIEDFFFTYVDKGVRDLGVFMGLLEKALLQGQEIVLTVKGYASPLAKSDYNERRI